MSASHASLTDIPAADVAHTDAKWTLADEDGQILDAHSISAGLDFPGVGPEHVALRDSGRARYITANSAPEPPDGLDHMRVFHSAIRIGFHALKLSSPSLCGRLRVTA